MVVWKRFCTKRPHNFPTTSSSAIPLQLSQLLKLPFFGIGTICAWRQSGGTYEPTHTDRRRSTSTAPRHSPPAFKSSGTIPDRSPAFPVDILRRAAHRSSIDGCSFKNIYLALWNSLYNSSIILTWKIQDSDDVPVPSSTLIIHRNAWITFFITNRGHGAGVQVSKTALDVSNGCPGSPAAETISLNKICLGLEPTVLSRSYSCPGSATSLRIGRVVSCRAHTYTHTNTRARTHAHTRTHAPTHHHHHHHHYYILATKKGHNIPKGAVPGE